MAWKTMKFRLTGDCPMLMHNGQLANPLSASSKALKRVTSKRAKTDADHERMAELEYHGSLYLTDDGPVLPGECVEAAIGEGAKKTKEGKLAKSCCFVPQHSRLEYEGPRDAAKLFEHEDFKLVAPVRVGTNRVMRTRPMFKEWAATVDVSYEDSVVNGEQIVRWVAVAGTLVGVGDWRPRYGRFTATEIDGSTARRG